MSAHEPQHLPEMVDARDLARILSISKATVERMKAAGKLPAHVELSRGTHRWRRDEILAWIEAGCPIRRDWEILRQARGDRCRRSGR